MVRLSIRPTVDNEEAYHKTVNSALSKTLIPDAENAELKSLLEGLEGLRKPELQTPRVWRSNCTDNVRMSRWVKSRWI